MMEKKVYLIIDAKIPLSELQEKLGRALPLLNKIQFYNTEHLSHDALLKLFEYFFTYCTECFVYKNKAALALHPNLGIHLDTVEDLSGLEAQLGREIKKGVTVGNDLEKVKKAEELKYDYISFCSVFPSKSAETCELVQLENIRKARSLFSKEIFLAGGISPENQKKLNNLSYDGVAVISIVMDAKNPIKIIQNLK